jgi:hypothetical protein
MKGHGSMALRGVARPMMGDPDGMEDMTPAKREEMRDQHHQKTLWVHLLVVLLGVWLISSPFTFEYSDAGLAGSGVAHVTAERGLPSVVARGTALVWSDAVSGILLVVLGLLSLSARRLWAPWAACFLGIWLLFAPLVLWAPSAAAYFNDTMVGALVIALTVLIPGMPGMSRIMKMGPEVPPGWSYNPSSWLQRAPVIVLAWAGFFLSRHLTAYQMGYIDTAWDPFFGRDTMRVLDSDVSRAFPISDAGLGTVAYTIEALMGYMGGPARWRTMPWMVAFFGILVVPLGVVSITLVILQPVMVGAWATLALAAAVAMLVMIPLAVDEVVAMGQFLAQSRREGKSLWHTFWKGGTVQGGSADERSPHFAAPIAASGPAMAWGVTVPGTLLASALLGIWLMAAPAVFGTEGSTASSNYLVGALITTTAVIAMAEVTRAARFLNVLLGAWIVAVPWLLGGPGSGLAWSNAIAGSAVILLSFPRGVVREHYGSWDRRII